jgi:hypothetical protein
MSALCRKTFHLNVAQDWSIATSNFNGSGFTSDSQTAEWDAGYSFVHFDVDKYTYTSSFQAAKNLGPFPVAKVITMVGSYAINALSLSAFYVAITDLADEAHRDFIVLEEPFGYSGSDVFSLSLTLEAGRACQLNVDLTAGGFMVIPTCTGALEFMITDA